MGKRPSYHIVLSVFTTTDFFPLLCLPVHKSLVIIYLLCNEMNVCHRLAHTQNNWKLKKWHKRSQQANTFIIINGQHNLQRYIETKWILTRPRIWFDQYDYDDGWKIHIIHKLVGIQVNVRLKHLHLI